MSEGKQRIASNKIKDCEWENNEKQFRQCH